MVDIEPGAGDRQSNLKNGRLNMRRLVSEMKLLLMLLFAMWTAHAMGQVVPAASGGGNQANAFGMFTFNHSDYDPSFNYGGTFGADYRFGSLRFGQPAVAARVSFVPNGGLVGENTYLVGPEWHTRVSRLRPYVDFHIGYATISYSKITEEQRLFHVSSKSGTAYEFGGGVDYRLARNYGVRIVDFQYQFWNVGKGNLLRPGRPPIVNGPILYSPYQISTGFYYRFR